MIAPPHALFHTIQPLIIQGILSLSSQLPTIQPPIIAYIYLSLHTPNQKGTIFTKIHMKWGVDSVIQGHFLLHPVHFTERKLKKGDFLEFQFMSLHKRWKKKKKNILFL